MPAFFVVAKPKPNRPRAGHENHLLIMKVLYIILCIFFALAFFGGLGRWQAFGADVIRAFSTIVSLVLSIIFGIAAGNVKKKK